MNRSKIAEPSSGGIGNRLNTPSDKFTMAKKNRIRNPTGVSDNVEKRALSMPWNTRWAAIAAADIKKRLVAGPARDTHSGSRRGLCIRLGLIGTGFA